MRRISIILASATLVLASCGGGGGTTAVVPPPATCSTVGQNQFVLDLMQDIYFWYDRVPNVDPADFSSPENLMDSVKYDALDRFSFINDQAADEAFFGEGQFVGVGVGTRFTGVTELKVSEVFPGGPAALAGLVRGDEILESPMGQGISADGAVSFAH